MKGKKCNVKTHLRKTKKGKAVVRQHKRKMKGPKKNRGALDIKTRTALEDFKREMTKYPLDDLDAHSPSTISSAISQSRYDSNLRKIAENERAIQDLERRERRLR